MRRHHLSTLATLLFSTALIPCAVAAPVDGHARVAPWTAQATAEGDAPDGRPVAISVVLGWRHADALSALVRSVSTPGSPGYGQYLSPETFHARFAPSAADAARVQAVLHAYGFADTNVPASNLFVAARGTVANVRAMFGVDQKLFAIHGRLLRTNTRAATLPRAIADIAVGVTGLDEAAIHRFPALIGQDETSRPWAKPNRAASAADGPPGPPTVSNTPPAFCSDYFGSKSATLSTAAGAFGRKIPYTVCGYTPQQMQTAYGVSKVRYRGAGVRVGIIDEGMSPTMAWDLARWSRVHDLPEPTAKTYVEVPPTGYNPACGAWYDEETLDVEAVHAMAPAARIVYAGTSYCEDFDTTMANLLDRHLVDIITNSYTDYSDDIPADDLVAKEDLFEQAAAEGVTLSFATGDMGDLVAVGYSGVATGSWESTSPLVTGVGGTSLALYDRTGRKDEYGWGSYRALLTDATVSADGKTIADNGLGAPDFYSGAGGGPSVQWELPWYQEVAAAFAYTTLGIDSNGNPYTFDLPYAPQRVTPDIAMDADPYTGLSIGETEAYSGDPNVDSQCVPGLPGYGYCTYVLGGTSLASPLFAGMVALADQARSLAGKPMIGFANPALYALAVGRPGATSAPLVDVRAPAAPTSVLRTYVGNPAQVRLVSLNAAIDGAGNASEGFDTSLVTQPGYDNTTGIGVPYAPEFITGIAALY